MKTLLIFVAVIGVASAGVGVLSPREEAEALQLFENLCVGYGAEGKNLGNTLVYCKKQPGLITEHTKHKIHVPGNPAQDQAVFVQPAPVVYRHNVQVENPGSPGQRTKIYVLPQQATHQVTSEFKQGAVAPEKPVVYFLGRNNSPPPPPDYGYPETKPPPSYAPPTYVPPPPAKETLPPKYGPTTTEPPRGYSYIRATKPTTSYGGLSARLVRSHEGSTSKPLSKNRVSRIRFEE